MLKAPYPIPASESRTEIKVSNSRFIATAAPVFTVDEAKAFVQKIRQEFASASHNVPAYLVGFGPSVTAHCHDDGEPSGTAGRPLLAVLQGSGLGDVAVVITRYFGGTKLGTGGLVRAYTEAGQAILQILPRAHKIPTDTLLLALPYTHFDPIRLLVAAHNGRILEQTFASDITLTLQFTSAETPAFQRALQEQTHGTLAAEIISANQPTIMLLPPT